MIQNGAVGCIPRREIRAVSWYEIPGTNKPGWINPMVPTLDFADRKAYAAGGNLNGGAGSYLITLEVNISQTNNVSWVPTQFNYDFRANSNNTTSVIKAIGTAQSNHNRLYVATQDATFFSSSNQGTSWTKHSTASLPSTMIPWDIKTSNTNADKVFICGTGFSNTGVFQSLNGGNTFTALSTDIPAATFYEVALSTHEDMLFAATSEGPYVYVFAQNRWYSLIGANTPILDFNTVDNLGNSIIRFGTYGRGIWDFQINSTALPVELAAFDARKDNNTAARLDWVTASELNTDYFGIEHSTNSRDFQTLDRVQAQGESGYQVAYSYRHNNPAEGLNYYRLRMTDKDGQFSLSIIKALDFGQIGKNFAVYPTVAAQFQAIHIVPQTMQPYDLELFSQNGQQVKKVKQQEGPTTIVADWERGVYLYRITAAGKSLSGKVVVQ